MMNRRHVSSRQVEVEHANVPCDACGIGCTRQGDYPVLLNQPTKDDLGNGLVMPRSDVFKHRIVENPAHGHPAIRRYGHPQLTAFIDQEFLVEVWVVLELVGHDGGSRQARRLSQELPVEVAHPNVPDLAGFNRCIESHDLLGQGHSVARPVEQQKIDVVGSQLPQALVDGRAKGAFGIVGDPDLRGEESLSAFQAGCLDTLANLFFVAIDLRGVDVPEPGSQCLWQGAHHVASRHAVRAKAERRNAGAVRGYKFHK